MCWELPSCALVNLAKMRRPEFDFPIFWYKSVTLWRGNDQSTRLRQSLTSPTPAARKTCAMRDARSQTSLRVRDVVEVPSRDSIATASGDASTHAQTSAVRVASSPGIGGTSGSRATLLEMISIPGFPTCSAAGGRARLEINAADRAPFCTL